MQPKYHQLYHDLLKDLQCIGQLEISEEESIESCFKCSIAYWDKLKEFIKVHDFESEAEEIQFFKYEKSLFTGLIEYYVQRYQALLFIPAKSNEERLFFWEKELRKMDKFYDTHTAFCQYYKGDASDRDHDWFLRRGNDGSNFEKARVYDLDADSVTSHDWLVSFIVAYEKYREYVQGELEKLQKNWV
jgi:RteC protein